MAIILSNIEHQLPQKDGRTYVKEVHIDHAGNAHEVEYLADAGVDVEAVMAARVAEIEARLKQAELVFYERLVLEGTPIMPDYPPVHSTVQEVYGHLFNAFCLETDPVKLLKAANFTDLFTDEELFSYGLSAEQVQAIRDAATRVKNAKALLGEYVPPLGG